jgi:UDP-2,3-diacylglucosamine pyrophosphatase LpxH
MNKEDIIRLAREACRPDAPFRQYVGGVDCGLLMKDEHLERFAALVATAEKQKVVEYMNSRTFATGHGDTIEDLLKEMEWQAAEREREACAEYCERAAKRLHGMKMMQDYRRAAEKCAEGIRARGY